MPGDTSESTDALPRDAQQVVDQARIDIQATDELSRAVGSLEFPDGFVTTKSGYDGSGYFDINALAKLFIYQRAADISQNKAAEKIEDNQVIRVRLGLDQPVTQQTISYFVGNRIPLDNRRKLEAVADKIRDLALEHDTLEDIEDPPQPSPDEVDETTISSAEIRNAVETAREDLLTAYNSGRAANAKYDDTEFWEMAALLPILPAGTQEAADSHSDLYPEKETPDADTLEYTIKKTGEPKNRVPTDENHVGEEWYEIRNSLVKPFNRAVGSILDKYDTGDQIREPVDVAIDITQWRFYPPPDGEKVNGIPVEEFPEMVSGTEKKDDHGRRERAYKFATLTIVGQDTPLTVAIEPVKEQSWWQEESEQIDEDEVSTTPKHEVIDRLLTQAEQHIDIHRVFVDRGLSNYKSRSVIDQHGQTYIVPIKLQGEPDDEFLEMIEETVSRAAVEEDEVIALGNRHGEYGIYVPAQSDDRDYIQFRTNATGIDPDRGAALVNIYSDRWQIESEYNSLKNEFLPDAVSKDYRMRLFYFILGAMMCNLWRLTNLLVRRDSDVDLGEDPPVSKGRVKVQVLVLSFKQRGIG